MNRKSRKLIYVLNTIETVLYFEYFLRIVVLLVFRATFENFPE